METWALPAGPGPATPNPHFYWPGSVNPSPHFDWPPTRFYWLGPAGPTPPEHDQGQTTPSVEFRTAQKLVESCAPQSPALHVRCAAEHTAVHD